jgi:putative PIN family toxin of toxin-antitoxin system
LIRAVVDTNVLVSAMISKEGPPAIVLTLSLRGLIMPIFNRSILAEYGRVLRRPRFGFASARTTLLLDTIEGIGLETQDGSWPETLPDPDDGKFLVAAVAGDAVLITGNLRDFPEDRRRRVPVMSPRQFIDTYADEILNFPGGPPA